MIAEKNISICGKEINIRYCMASETGYEVISGNSSEIFLPHKTGTDDNGEPIYEPPKAQTGDFLRLAFACIVAAYESKGEETPISVNEILYEATPEEITALITTTIELRKEWYNIPAVVKPETEEKESESKND